jgi:hypothetical protein
MHIKDYLIHLENESKKNNIESKTTEDR